MQQIYLSFTKSDQLYADRLRINTKPVLGHVGYELWSRKSTLPGGRWEKEMEEHLSNVHFFIALLSPDYFADGMCEDEMCFADSRRQEGVITMIPVLIRPCTYKYSPFASLLCLPENKKPISQWNNKDKAWLHVAQRLGETLTG